MTPLTTDVKAATDSSFKITTPTGYVTGTVGASTARIGNEDVPMYKVPKNDTSTAEFAIDGITANKTGIYVTGAGTVSSGGVSSQAGDKPVVVTGSITTPAATPSVLGVEALTIEITTPNEDGLSRIAFELPVCAIDPGAPDTNVTNPITWYIRGGLQNALFDEGQAKESLGGAILFGVGTVSAYPIVTTP